MDISSIAATSVYSNQSQIQQIASIAIAKKAMDGQEAAASQLIETLKEVAPPPTSKLDITV